MTRFSRFSILNTVLIQPIGREKECDVEQKRKREKKSTYIIYTENLNGLFGSLKTEHKFNEFHMDDGSCDG